MSICSYNGVVENDDLALLSLFTTNRKLPMTTNIRSEFSDCQWCQWQPMAHGKITNGTIGTNGKITNGTTGKTPNARIVVNAEEEEQTDVLVDRLDTTAIRCKMEIGRDRTKVVTSNPNGF